MQTVAESHVLACIFCNSRLTKQKEYDGLHNQMNGLMSNTFGTNGMTHVDRHHQKIQSHKKNGRANVATDRGDVSHPLDHFQLKMQEDFESAHANGVIHLADRYRPKTQSYFARVDCLDRKSVV